MGGERNAEDPNRKEEEETVKNIAAELGQETEEKPAAEKYLISICQRGTVYRLHRADGCWRARGQRFAHHIAVETDVPDPKSCTSICKDCVPDAVPAKRATSSSCGSSSSSSAS